MARIKTRDGGDTGVVMDYLAPVTSVVATAGTASTVTVVLASVLATDIIIAQFASQATASYITAITASAGAFAITFNTSPGIGTVNYAVFHLNV